MLLYLFCSTEPFQLYISVVICHGLPVERIHAMRSYTQYMSMPNTQTNICRMSISQTDMKVRFRLSDKLSALNQNLLT